MKTRIIASIDVGTSKIAVLIAEVDNYGDIHIIGLADRESRGVQRGAVTKLEVAARSIALAVGEAENMAGKKIESVVINISGDGLKSQNEKETFNLSPSPIEIEDEHIARLIKRCVDKAKEDRYEIVHAIPRKFNLDDYIDIEDPKEMSASKLEAQVHIVKVPDTLSRNMVRTINRAGFEPDMIVVNALASAKAVLKEEEKEEGVLMLDIGAGLTDFVLFTERAPILTGCIPLGGIHITRDISHYMKVNIEEAERIKEKHGVAYVDMVKDTDIIKIKPRGEDREVSANKTELAEVIQIRLEEIMDGVKEQIKKAGINYEEVAKAGVVITGGTAELKGIKEFIENYLDLPSRIGAPSDVKGLRDRVERPTYSTAYGLLEFWRSPQGVVSSEEEVKVNGRSWFSELVDKVKNFLKDIS